MNNFKNKLKNKTNNLFSYPKIKSKQLREKIDFKIREKAILATRARLAENHKTFEDFQDEQLEIIISDEERKIKDELKTKTVYAALALLGLNIFI